MPIVAGMDAFRDAMAGFGTSSEVGGMLWLA